ncbi:uncharacterized protein B0H18DRAFT_964821 [Fomitopsis serialis]|uniref:uncharacterized protein n=1 Tax=Fomitopsis serialis TaxID=139415 RepID=UPI0020082849|nr:uncharacterized protein B0H18DRAFT_964821 [Neoantrodia serialis]KAH9906081.1 hypothetical protein B0H18DRAFT_964821 [Neoantrodia serialis]
MSCPTFDFSDPSKARKTMQRFAAHLKAAVNASPADLLDLTKKVGKILYDNCDAIVAAARGGALMPRIVGYAYEEYIGQLDFFLANIKEDDDRELTSIPQELVADLPVPQIMVDSLAGWWDKFEIPDDGSSQDTAHAQDGDNEAAQDPQPGPSTGSKRRRAESTAPKKKVSETDNDLAKPPPPKRSRVEAKGKKADSPAQVSDGGEPEVDVPEPKTRASRPPAKSRSSSAAAGKKDAPPEPKKKVLRRTPAQTKTAPTKTAPTKTAPIKTAATKTAATKTAPPPAKSKAKTPASG